MSDGLEMLLLLLLLGANFFDAFATENHGFKPATCGEPVKLIQTNPFLNRCIITQICANRIRCPVTCHQRRLPIDATLSVLCKHPARTQTRIVRPDQWLYCQGLHSRDTSKISGTLQHLWCQIPDSWPNKENDQNQQIKYHIKTWITGPPRLQILISLLFLFGCLPSRVSFFPGLGIMLKFQVCKHILPHSLLFSLQSLLSTLFFWEAGAIRPLRLVHSAS